MIPALCPECHPKALKYLEPMEHMKERLAAATAAARGADSASIDELERVLADAEKLARTFDALLCERCRKLGPPLPRIGEWPF